VPQNHPSTRDNRYPVLDALRFVLALWVMLGHYVPLPLFAGVDAASPFGRWVTHGWSSLIFGIPAVMVFLVISGFCIHFPHQGDAPMAVGRYYLRRFTRILVPVAAALCVYRAFGERLEFRGEGSILWLSPLWSLACEEIYYAAYPLLRFLRQRLGWKYLFPPVFVASAVMAATHPRATSFQEFGPFGTALILLPVWLLGGYLAEQSAQLPALTSARRIYLWRAAIWLACWSAEILHFKTKIHFPQTMLWFGVLAFFWVKNEIAYAKHQAPNRYLVAGGAWSYSLYLVHAQGVGLFWRLPIPHLNHFVSWFGAHLSSLGLAYAFYTVVERPSHRLARRVSQTRSTGAAPVAAPASQLARPLIMRAPL